MNRLYKHVSVYWAGVFWYVGVFIGILTGFFDESALWFLAGAGLLLNIRLVVIYSGTIKMIRENGLDDK